MYYMNVLGMNVLDMNACRRKWYNSYITLASLLNISPSFSLQMGFPAPSQPLLAQGTSQPLSVTTGMQAAPGGLPAGNMNPLPPHGGAAMSGMSPSAQQQQQQQGRSS